MFTFLSFLFPGLTEHSLLVPVSLRRPSLLWLVSTHRPEQLPCSCDNLTDVMMARFEGNWWVWWSSLALWLSLSRYISINKSCLKHDHVLTLKSHFRNCWITEPQRWRIATLILSHRGGSCIIYRPLLLFCRNGGLKQRLRLNHTLNHQWRCRLFPKWRQTCIIQCATVGLRGGHRLFRPTESLQRCRDAWFGS